MVFVFVRLSFLSASKTTSVPYMLFQTPELLPPPALFHCPLPLPLVTPISLLLLPHHSTSPSNPLLLFTPLSPSKILTSTYLCVQGVCGGGAGWGLRSQTLRVLLLQLEPQELNSVHHGVEARTFAYQAILPACFLLLKDNL